MANPEHVAKLWEGVKTWNAWRVANPEVKPDLVAAIHTRNDLNFVNLNSASLSRANFTGSYLSGAVFEKAMANFAYFKEADLRGANFARAVLTGANFTGANLSRTIFTEVELDETVFADVNLSGATGLNECVHKRPSVIDHRTLMRSGRLPDKFLRGCGLTDWQIEEAKLLNPDLTPNEICKIQYRVFELRSARPIQISPLFISYSHGDSQFVDTLEPLLEGAGILFWRDKHDMTAGRMDRVVERAMRQNPTLLTILSEASVESDWVQFEVKQGTKLSKELERDVLCPIALDGAWKTCDWPGPLRQQVEDFTILDFSEWQDPEKLDQMFRRLIRGLELFYKPKDQPND